MAVPHDGAPGLPGLFSRSEAMARVKGTAFKPAVDFLKARLAPAAFEDLVRGLTPAEQAIVNAPVLLSEWYEAGLVQRMMKLAEGRMKAAPGYSLEWEMGRFSAEAMLTTIYKIFFRVSDIGYIVKKAAYLYPTIHDSGVMEVVDVQKGQATIRIRNYNEPSLEFCDRLQGWMQKTVELTGQRQVVITHPRCLARGDDCCEYHGEWE
jgi:hypothetical protein